MYGVQGFHRNAAMHMDYATIARVFEYQQLPLGNLQLFIQTSPSRAGASAILRGDVRAPLVPSRSTCRLHKLKKLSSSPSLCMASSSLTQTPGSGHALPSASMTGSTGTGSSTRPLSCDNNSSTSAVAASTDVGCRLAASCPIVAGDMLKDASFGWASGFADETCCRGTVAAGSLASPGDSTARACADLRQRWRDTAW